MAVRGTPRVAHSFRHASPETSLQGVLCVGRHFRNGDTGADGRHRFSVFRNAGRGSVEHRQVQRVRRVRFGAVRNGAFQLLPRQRIFKLQYRLGESKIFFSKCTETLVTFSLQLLALVSPIAVMCSHFLVPAKNRSTFSQPYLLSLSPLFLWLAVFLVQPHKEERYAYLPHFIYSAVEL